MLKKISILFLLFLIGCSSPALPKENVIPEGQIFVDKADYEWQKSAIDSLNAFYEKLKSNDIDINATGFSTLLVCNEGCAYHWDCTSRSMLPTITCNDEIWGYKPKKADIHVGDMIGFNSPIQGYEIVIHRVIGIQDGKFITKGDNNNYFDEPVDFKDVRLKVTKIEYK